MKIKCAAIAALLLIWAAALSWFLCSMSEPFHTVLLVP